MQPASSRIFCGKRTDFVADDDQAIEEAACGIRRIPELPEPHPFSVLKAGPTRHVVD